MKSEVLASTLGLGGRLASSAPIRAISLWEREVFVMLCILLGWSMLESVCVGVLGLSRDAVRPVMAPRLAQLLGHFGKADRDDYVNRQFA